MNEILKELLRYPAIVDAKIVESAGSAWTRIETTWFTVLPNRYKAQGVSSTGVRDEEVVMLSFPPSYPVHPPSIGLRTDFPINLPHINPHQEGEEVPPCVSEIPLSELLHSLGLFGILSAIEDWLKNAVSNELHDPIQGWEPIRRADSNGILIVDAFDLRQQITKAKNNVNYFRVLYTKMQSGFCFGGIRGKCVGSDNNSLGIIRVEHNPSDSFSLTPGILIANQKACDAYQAEKVSTFEELIAFANYFELGDMLKARYKYLTEKIVSSNHNHHKNIVNDFFVVLAIKRPYPIIGVDGDLELLAYRVEASISKAGKLQRDSRCYPVIVQDICTPEMLKAVSGTKALPGAMITAIGCGSLGAKLTSHLAKTGSYGFQLIDNDYFSMHNNARQAIIETDITKLYQSKAELLDAEFKKLGIRSSALSCDVRLLDPKKNFYAKQGSGFILDSTASLAVRHFLSHDVTDLPATLIHTYLLNRSRLGVTVIEGIDRNPRIDDINAYIYQLGLNDDHYHQAIYRYDGPQSMHFGDGCGSFTTQMTDMDIAIPAASMAANLNKIINNPIHENGLGQLLLTNVADDYSVSVNTLLLAKTKIFPSNDAYPWEVRVLGNIAKGIEQGADEYHTFENGGILLGQFDWFSKTLYVTGLMEAPEDTERSATRFVLGTKGAKKALTEVAQRSGGKLSFIGTWHSHPNGEPPSKLDKDTLHKLQEDTDLPVVMLVQTGGRLQRIVE